MELTDDLSQATDEFHETLSRISKHSKQTTSQRVSDWVNEVNEPDSVSNQPQTNTVNLNNVAGSSNTAVIPESNDGVQMRQATLEMRSLTDVNIGLVQNQISRSEFRPSLQFHGQTVLHLHLLRLTRCPISKYQP